ncbi:MAG: vWA domain-containing protein [Shimia sp.]
MRFLLSLLLCLPAFAAAQAPNTILVLDGSGSMWGQIEGTNKIVIARDVVGTILEDFPQDQALGLTVYGHRVRGDCSDIETIVAPGLGTSPAIREAVNGINPRGKTPMTDAIIQAAESLRYTEEAATVILVSDGIETCNPDPCAAAAALEQAGIDFTAHVVGFDVTDPQALAQMQCIADNTGGTFTTAADASELRSALTRVAVAPEPIPDPMVAFQATLGQGGPLITSVVRWSLTPRQEAGEGVESSSPAFEAALPPGDWALRAQWEETGESIAQDFFIFPREGQTVTVAFEKPVVEVPVTFEARIGSENGPLVDGPVFWTLTAQDSVDVGSDNPTEVPLIEGAYTVTGYWAAQEVEASRQFVAFGEPRTIALVFEEPQATATLTMRTTAVGGSTIEVGFNGPGGANDFVAVRDPNRDDYHRFLTSAEAEGETGLTMLRVPVLPGMYPVDYVDGSDRSAITTVMIEVTPIPARVMANETATAGSTIDVGWEGPDYRNDFIAIRAPDAEGYHRFANSVGTDNGAPARLLMPTEPGDYVIEYIVSSERRAVASTPIKVAAIGATVLAPATAIAGSTIEVGWDGPDYRNDFIAIRRPDATGYHRFTNSVGTDEGAPAKLLMPIEPGTYMIEYIEAQNRSALAVAQIEVAPVSASLMVPQQGPAGEPIEVAWDGPDYRNDFIAIRKPEAEGYHRFAGTFGTRKGNPARLTMPTEPGTYVVEYIAGQNRSPLAAATIEVNASVVDIVAPAQVSALEAFEVSWTGPNQPLDNIQIGRPGESGYATYSYTERGNPLTLTAPAEAGMYELRYVFGDRTILHTAPLEVVAAAFSITAPATVPAATEFEIATVGPSGASTYVQLFRIADDKLVREASLRRGNVVSMFTPVEPGAYELRYRSARREILATQPVTVTEGDLALILPQTIAAGQPFEVATRGPSGASRYLRIVRPGETRGVSESSLRGGNIVTMTAPDEPGEYEVLYLLTSREVIRKGRFTVE